MIVLNNRRITGQLGVVKSEYWACVVSTAPEGLFKGFSSCFSYFDPKLDWNDAYRTGQLHLSAKAILHPSLSKAGRIGIHTLFLEELDRVGKLGFSFAYTLTRVVMQARHAGAVVDHVFDPVLSDTPHFKDAITDLEAAKAEEQKSEKEAAWLTSVKTNSQYVQ